MYTLFRNLDRAAAVLRRLGLGRLTRCLRDALDAVAAAPVGVEREGLRLYGGLRERSFLYRVTEGTFEPETVARFLAWLRPGATVVDVGAFLGFYTLLAARRVGESRVYALEPDPRSFAFLQRNLRANGCSRVKALPWAALEYTGEAPWYRSRNDPSTNSVVPRPGWSETAKVRCVALDEFLDSEGVQHVDVVKIDAEGSEPRVLKGMARVLGRSPDPVVFVELNPAALRQAGSSPEALLSLLGELGFRRVDRLDEERSPEGHLLNCNLCCRRGQESPGEAVNGVSRGVP